MTKPTPHGQVPEALRLAHIFDNPLPPEWPDMVAAAAELRRQHTRIAELEAQIEALSGVQALSAAPPALPPYPPLPMQFACSGVFAVYSADQMRAYVDADRAARAPADSVAAPAIGDELRDTLVAVSAAIAERDDRAAQKMIGEILAASPTSPAEQQAPSAAAADTVALQAALRAIHQAIDLIGEPDTERLRTVRRVLRGAVIVAEDAGEAATAPQPSSAPQTDSQPAVQQWNDLIGKETHADADGLLVWRDEVDFAIPTPPAEQQAAPKAAPAVGNSGFDHKTAADFLSGKTVSDEAVRNFVATSRWAHDERAALSATLLAMHGVLTSREAEIALLKKALLEAEAAPQQEAQKPGEIPESIERMATGRYKVVPSHESMFHRWAVVAGTGMQQLYLGREVECQNMARKFAGAFLDGAFVAMQRAAPQQEVQEPVALLVRKNSWRAGQWEAAPPDSPHYGLTWANQRKYVYEAPQPAPAPLSDDTERLNWLLWKLPGNALRYVVGELADTSSGAEFRAAIDAARKQGVNHD